MQPAHERTVQLAEGTAAQLLHYHQLIARVLAELQIVIGHAEVQVAVGVQLLLLLLLYFSGGGGTGGGFGKMLFSVGGVRRTLTYPPGIFGMRSCMCGTAYSWHTISGTSGKEGGGGGRRKGASTRPKRAPHHDGIKSSTERDKDDDLDRFIPIIISGQLVQALIDAQTVGMQIMLQRVENRRRTGALVLRHDEHDDNDQQQYDGRQNRYHDTDEVWLRLLIDRFREEAGHYVAAGHSDRSGNGSVAMGSQCYLLCVTWFRSPLLMMLMPDSSRCNGYSMEFSWEIEFPLTSSSEKLPVTGTAK
uniref:Uncharacterized protein n=1 Tax=Anopheles farauti TaxID=69004 RepID=A0A182QXN0_9DIPT